MGVSCTTERVHLLTFDNIPKRARVRKDIEDTLGRIFLLIHQEDARLHIQGQVFNVQCSSLL